MSFMSLGLSKPLLDALAAKDYSQPTPIQRQAIPTVLTGRDLLGIAQTGTGKTAAFVLPSLDRLAADAQHSRSPARFACWCSRRRASSPRRSPPAPQPTAASCGCRSASFSAAFPIARACAKSRAASTCWSQRPGRLLDLVDQRALTLRELEILVLDEADQMLDLGFIHALKRIVALVPAKRQTLFFSATMPKAIKELADRYLTNPAEVSVTPAATTVERVEQSVTFVNQAEKAALLTLCLQQTDRSSGRWCSAAPSTAPTRSSASSKRPASRPARSTATRASRSASARSPAFKSGEMRVLVATDIAARGIDIPGVSHVVNFDLPDVPEQYVHRIGRTARAGADGIAIAFCSHEERGNLRDIERLTRQKLDGSTPLPADFCRRRSVQAR